MRLNMCLANKITKCNGLSHHPEADSGFVITFYKFCELFWRFKGNLYSDDVGILLKNMLFPNFRQPKKEMINNLYKIYNFLA